MKTPVEKLLNFSFDENTPDAWKGRIKKALKYFEMFLVTIQEESSDMSFSMPPTEENFSEKNGKCVRFTEIS